MARDQMNRVLSGEVPTFDHSRFAQWYVAVREESGLRRGLLAIDQQMRRTDRAMTRAFEGAKARGATGAAAAASGSGTFLDRLGESLERVLLKIPSPY